MKEKHIPTEYEIKTKSNREPIGIILGLPAEKIASDDLAKLMRTPRSLMYMVRSRKPSFTRLVSMIFLICSLKPHVIVISPGSPKNELFHGFHPGLS